jgi:hypothetical protein
MVTSVDPFGRFVDALVEEQRTRAVHGVDPEALLGDAAERAG